MIIPVYNAAALLPQAIQSALAQAEVSEIILIDDGSKDQSLQVATMYAQNHPGRIRVLSHGDGKNHGAGATRNLGMQHARSSFIAFLDADDIYLEGRFTQTVYLFTKYPDADGIYETVESRTLDPDSIVEYNNSVGPQFAQIEPGSPESFFVRLASQKGGYIHLDGVVIKQRAINDSLYFDQTLRQCQDTDFILRWASFKKLYGGDPHHVVALRRIHPGNRVLKRDEALHFRYLCMRKCALQHFYGSHDRKAKWAILNRMARATRFVRTAKAMHLPVTPFRLAVILGFLAAHPVVAVNLAFRSSQG